MKRMKTKEIKRGTKEKQKRDKKKKRMTKNEI